MEQDHPVMYAALKIVLAWGAYVGSITLSEWQAIVGIVGGLTVIAFTALQLYILWRDKIVRHRNSQFTRSTDTAPVGLGD